MKQKKKSAGCIVTAAALFAAAVTMLPTAASAEDTPSSPVVINEVCTQNKNCFTDSYGTASDWIELYNTGDEAFDLSGWGLSDDEDNALKFTFPEGTSIGAGEYLVVAASKDASTDTELHTGFALSKSGETLTLCNAAGEVLEKLEIPALGEDMTYGRIAGGKYEIMSPTPNASNEEVLSAPLFSAESGFYDTNFQLTLTADDGLDIYYTLDGTDPTVSDTAVKFSSPITVKDRTNEPNGISSLGGGLNQTGSILFDREFAPPNFNIDKATVVRAAAKNADDTFSSVGQQTYFVTNGNLDRYSDTTVISLVTDPDNLYGEEEGIFVLGKQYIDWLGKNPGVSLDPFSGENPVNFCSRGKEWEREASMTIFENGVKDVEQNIGIRIRGAGTRNQAQKSFNLYARTDYGNSKVKSSLLFPENTDLNGKAIKKYDSFSIRSTSSYHGALDYCLEELIKDRENITTCDMKPCVLFINGEYWGEYIAAERICSDMLESKYDVSKDDIEIVKSDEIDEGPEESCNELLDFAYDYAGEDLTDPEMYKAVADYIDLDTMIEHYAIGIMFGVSDWPNYNYSIWRYTGEPDEENKYSDGKWRYVTYDLDFACGDENGLDRTSFRRPESITELFVALLDNEEFRSKFLNTCCDYANSVASNEKIEEMVKTITEKYSSDFAWSDIRWNASSRTMNEDDIDFESKYLGNIKNYFNTVNSREFLENLGDAAWLDDASVNELTIKTIGGGSVKVNTVTPVGADSEWSGMYFAEVPVTLTAVPDENGEFKGWGGDADSTDTTITVTLSEAMNITADFGSDAPQGELGDVNGDGAVNPVDATAILQQYTAAAAGKKDVLNAEQMKIADVNGDGRINPVDATAVLGYYTYKASGGTLS